MRFHYLEQFLVTTGVFLQGLHDYIQLAITHVGIQLLKDISYIHNSVSSDNPFSCAKKTTIFSWLAYLRKINTLEIKKGGK